MIGILVLVVDSRSVVSQEVTERFRAVVTFSLTLLVEVVGSAWAWVGFRRA